MTNSQAVSMAALIGRLFYSSMYLVFAYLKLTGYSGTSAYMTKLGLPEPALFVVLAIGIELGGGLLMLVGYQTQLVALGLAIYVLVTAFLGHFHLGEPGQLTHFMKNMAIIGGSLAFAACGGGVYSLDAQKPLRVRSPDGRSLRASENAGSH